MTPIRPWLVTAVIALATASLVPCAGAKEDVKFQRTEDVIYARKFGVALTMDVFTPEKTNGKTTCIDERPAKARRWRPNTR